MSGSTLLLASPLARRSKAGSQASTALTTPPTSEAVRLCSAMRQSASSSLAAACCCCCVMCALLLALLVDSVSPCPLRALLLELLDGLGPGPGAAVARTRDARGC